jgi:uncharacterized SAM-binding protein YcdF (DUF218 family)
MFFILSKTLSYLALPLTIVIILLIVSGILRNPRRKKIAFWCGVGLLIFFSNDFIANEAMKGWEVKTMAMKEMKTYSLGIVLTGSTIPNREPNDRVYFARGADRVTHTVQLYNQGLLKKILISGGSGSLKEVDEPEANKFRAAMIMMGVDSADIVIENQTRNTHESAVEVKKMLETIAIPSSDCLLITSAFHMRRSLACYRKVGVELTPFSTDFYSHQQTYYIDAFIVPKLDALVIWHKLFKEWVGFTAYWMAGYV